MCSILPGINHIPTLVDFPQGEIRHVQISRVGKSGRNATHASFSPGENDTGEFLPGRNVTHASFSPGENDTGEFLPGRNATHASFSPGENDTGEFLPGRKRYRRVSPREKCDTCEISPGENDTGEFLPGRNATHANFSPGENDTGEFLPDETQMGPSGTFSSTYVQTTSHSVCVETLT
jgi:hypothetical protein